MARGKGFGNLSDLAKDLDRNIPSAFLIGAIRSAEQTVSQLQKAGPSWTGRLSNSWQIEGPQGQGVTGTGQEGDPVSIKFMQAPFTGRQATQTLIRTTVFKDKVVFKISNFSEHFLAATDRELQPREFYQEGWVLSPQGPKTRQGKANFFPVDSGRKDTSVRGDIGGGNPESESSRTAPQDWFSTFQRGGKVDKTVKIEMDKSLRRVFK